MTLSFDIRDVVHIDRSQCSLTHPCALLGRSSLVWASSLSVFSKCISLTPMIETTCAAICCSRILVVNHRRGGMCPMCPMCSPHAIHWANSSVFQELGVGFIKMCCRTDGNLEQLATCTTIYRDSHSSTTVLDLVVRNSLNSQKCVRVLPLRLPEGRYS